MKYKIKFRVWDFFGIGKINLLIKVVCEFVIIRFKLRGIRKVMEIWFIFF